MLKYYPLSDTNELPNERREQMQSEFQLKVDRFANIQWAENRVFK